VQPTKRIGLEIPDEESLRVAAPESMVAMVIGNLVRNALQHGTGDEVVCRLQGRELTVANAGALPNEKLSETAPRRFTTHPRGHGMGLYLVRRICERYRWALRLENTRSGVLVTVGF
jgi:signal transduction histidine kinase